MSNKKKARPISRKIWNYLRFMPKSLRTQVIRGQFDIIYEHDPNLVLKMAETQDEISQALSLLYKSYLNLGYIDPHPAQLRISENIVHPTTMILIAKYGEEVVGTISILLDSEIGLPVDQSWDLSQLRKNGKILGEISGLGIKKNYKMRRGQLLLLLCKVMYVYAKNILKLNRIVIATTSEVEPFYTDVILFKVLGGRRDVKHDLVKGNPSIAAYLDLDYAEKKYHKEYGDKEPERNLYRFFCETEHSCIHLVEPDQTLQKTLNQKNKSMDKLISQNPSVIDLIDTTKLSFLIKYDVYEDMPFLFHKLQKNVIYQGFEKIYITSMEVTLINSVGKRKDLLFCIRHSQNSSLLVFNHSHNMEFVGETVGYNLRVLNAEFGLDLTFTLSGVKIGDMGGYYCEIKAQDALVWSNLQSFLDSSAIWANIRKVS